MTEPTPRPPSFEVVPGDAASPVVLHVPHASRTIPTDVRRGILLDGDALEHELDAITDVRTDEIALAAADAAAVRPWVFVNRLSRLVVDPERFPDERKEMNEVGMGAVYERTTGLGVLRRPTDAERASLLSAFFDPYADALATLVRERLAATGRVTVLDVHSYARDALPYERHGDGPRPEVCLGTDAFHTPPPLVAAARACFEPDADDIGLDSPFAGCYVPLEHFGVEPAVTGLMLELRRDVVADRIDRLASATSALVDRVEAGLS